jgi:hypothetical protein
MANVLIPKKSTVAAKVPTTSDLALGEIAINHADAKLYARHPVSGTVQEIGAAAGSLSIDSTAADLFSATSGTLSADDLGSDKIYFWDDSAGRATGLDLGTGLAISGTTLNNTGSLTGTGTVDNAILRADGTGGATLQPSPVSISDVNTSLQTTVAIGPDRTTFSITGDAGTDVITATGHNFVTNQAVSFPTLTGGNGLNTFTRYFVRDVTASTFKVSTTIGGGAIDFTTNITAGTVRSSASLVLLQGSEYALESIQTAIPDGTAVGGSARGNGAVDLSMYRAAAADVASAVGSFVGPGYAGRASGNYSAVLACYDTRATDQYALAAGYGARAGGNGSMAMGEFANASGRGSAVYAGATNTASAQSAGILAGANALANRIGMQAHAYGQFSAQGDAQRARFVMRNTTTGTTTAELFLDGSSTRLTIPSGKVMAFTINICGIRNGGADVAHYIRQYALKNLAGTTTQVYAPVTIGTDTATGTTIALSANDTNDALRVDVTGVTGQTWRWVAAIDAVEITAG